jgi:hypothetical protein
MEKKERRKSAHAIQQAMKRELNEAQLSTLNSLEPFGWELKFVRRPMFQLPVAIVFDGDRKTFAVLELDGSDGLPRASGALTRQGTGCQ